jgi:protein KTI12
LTEYFEGLGKKVLVVNEESLMLVRSEVYASGQAEKEARGAVKAAVERFVDQNTLVIADHMNAIKGFRYELYCRARSLKSLHCVVFCKTQAEICKAWNSERSEDQRYTDEQ